MKVCFLLNDLSLSGGVGVVVQHARRLSKDHGFDVRLLLTEARTQESWPYGDLEGIAVGPIDDMSDETFDVAVATWWETVYRLFSVKAERYAYFVQSLEDRFYYDGDPERLAAGATLDLPVAFITEAAWIRDFLANMRADASCRYVRNGIAKDVFAGSKPAPPRRPDGPLRIVVEGACGVWYKGIDEAFRVIALMNEARRVTLIDPERNDETERSTPADRVLHRLSQEDMAKAYAESDVLLKLSRVEGMFGPPLEAFHMGATCVVYPVTGHDEYVVHGWNGIVTDWDDLHGAARWLDLLARDRGFLHSLRLNALKTAAEWPSWEDSAADMALALRAIAKEPSPSPPSGVPQLLRDVRVATEDYRRRIAGLERTRTDLENVWADADRMRELALASGDEVNEAKRLRTEAEDALRRAEAQLSQAHAELNHAQVQLESITRTRAYHAAVLLRRVWNNPRLRPLLFPLRLADRAWRALR